LGESALAPEQRIVQVVNSLLSIAQTDDDAIAAIFPCDHHYSDEPLFAASLESAFLSAAEHPNSVVLLGRGHPSRMHGDC
jgi:hypothetical protein